MRNEELKKKNEFEAVPLGRYFIVFYIVCSIRKSGDGSSGRERTKQNMFFSEVMKSRLYREMLIGTLFFAISHFRLGLLVYLR